MRRGAAPGIASQSVCRVGCHWNAGLELSVPLRSWAGAPFPALSGQCPCRSLRCRAPCVGESGSEAEDPGLGGGEHLPCGLLVFPSASWSHLSGGAQVGTVTQRAWSASRGGGACGRPVGARRPRPHAAVPTPPTGCAQECVRGSRSAVASRMTSSSGLGSAEWVGPLVGGVV